MARTKAEVLDLIEKAGGEVSEPDSMTVPQLEELLKMLEADKAAAAANDTAAGGNDTPAGDDGEDDKLTALGKPGGVTRRKLNRGSTRRINRALEAIQKACRDFADEIDTQVFVTDEDGKRVDEIDLVKGFRAMPDDLAIAVAEFTTPA